MQVKNKEILYYARIQPSLCVYEVCELVVRTVSNSWFTGIDKRDKRVYLFSNRDIDKRVFRDRKCALNIIKEAEKDKNKNTFTTDSKEEVYGRIF